MKVLVVYDSKFGNTKLIAEAIAGQLRDVGEVKLFNPLQVVAAELVDTDLLIIGSPTQGGQPTQDIGTFVAGLPMGSVKEDLKAAVFDTRLDREEHGFALGLLMKSIGFAAPKMAHALQTKGVDLALAPEGFVVEDKEGPLKPGELERAEDWSENILQTVTSKATLIA